MKGRRVTSISPASSSCITALRAEALSAALPFLPPPTAPWYRLPKYRLPSLMAFSAALPESDSFTSSTVCAVVLPVRVLNSLHATRRHLAHAIHIQFSAQHSLGREAC